MQDEQAAGEIGYKCPVRPWGAPLPEVVRPVRRIFVLEGEVRGRRPVRERDVQEQEVDDNHEQGLDEQRGAEVGAEPVVHFEDAGDEHDERDIEREAG